MTTSNAALKISPEGLTFIKLFESFVPYPYDDLVLVHGRYPEWTGGKPKGTITIGYGSTASDLKITPGMRLSEAQASQLLQTSLENVYGQKVKSLVTRDLAQHEFDALTSWAYNTGGPSNSSVWARVNAGEDPSDVLMQYVRSKGQVLQGLVRRRRAEIMLYHGDVAGALKLAGS